MASDNGRKDMEKNIEKDMRKDMESRKEIYDRFIRDMEVLGPDEGTVSGIRVSMMKKMSASRVTGLRIVMVSSAAAALLLAAMLFPALMPHGGPGSSSSKTVSAAVLYTEYKDSEGSRLYAAYRNSLERRQYILENHIPDRQE